MPIETPPTGGGGGGSEPKTGTSVSLSAAQAGLANGTTILFDVVVWESPPYYNPATGIFTIPPGKDGIYLLAGYGEVAWDGVTPFDAFQYDVLVGGAFPDNIVMSGSPQSGSHTVMDLSGAAIVQFAAGDAFHVTLQFAGPATVTLFNGASGFGCYLLGS